jgi:hypothetical protein
VSAPLEHRDALAGATMLNLADYLPPSEQHDRFLPGAVRTFLIASERRVLYHCLALLRDKGLPDGQRLRLTRLAETAETGLRRLMPDTPLPTET